MGYSPDQNSTHTASPACQSAYGAVQELARNFAAHQVRYLAASYQEAEARVDLIDTLLMALGWDVRHEQQRNPYQQEVRIERHVLVRGAKRRADYALFIQPEFQRERLFIEAKRPAHALKNADYYFQAIRYAFSRGHALTVLTNFRELHVLDCRAKPDINTVLNRCLKAFDLADYADENKFAELYYLLSRDAVAAGALEQFAASFVTRRGGKQLLLLREAQKFDETFLADLDNYRERLAKLFKKENPELSGEALTEIVQRTLDRLVFIRFLEDKLILPDTLIDKFAQRGNAWGSFIDAGKKLNATYNGIVFKSLPALDEFDYAGAASGFIEICEELSGQYSPYDFSQIPLDILGSIYERFLGKVIRATTKQVKVEEKEEVRKAGGVFYTPDYIVRYIVKHTVGAAIKNKTPEDIAQLYFADIACGSGSFLLGIFEELLDYHRQWYAAHPASAKQAGCRRGDNGEWIMPLAQKRQILLNNIYGVDIDSQAAEVAQLSLYLKLLEDETTASAHQYSLDYHVPLLPMLSKNIVCGNALVGRDILESQLFARDEERRMNPLDFVDVFPQVARAGGFSAIIGNPPYVRQESLGNLFKDYAARRYTTFVSTADLYTYFIEQAHRNLRADGYFGYIVSNKFIRANYGRPLRAYLGQQTTLRQIIDFGELPVFIDAATFPAILITQNKPTQKQQFIHAAIKRLDFEALEDEVAANGNTLDESALSGDNWSLAARQAVALLNKIKATGKPLGDLVGDKIYRGVLTGLNEAFVINAETRARLVAQDKRSQEIIKPFALGDDVRHYEICRKDKFLIFTKHGVNIDSYPAIKTYLEQYKDRLTPKPKKFRGKVWKGRKPGNYQWYEIQDTIDYYKLFDAPKIVYPDIAKESRFALDTQGMYLANTCYMIATADLALLALLNSKLVYWYFKSIASVLGDADKGGRLRWIRQDVTRIPIAPIDETTGKELNKLVTRMLAAKQARANALTDKDRNYFERECGALTRSINTLVYQLYGLNAEEIALIETAQGGSAP